MAAREPNEHADALPSPEAGASRSLPREARMRRSADFRRAYAEGVRARGSTLLVVVRPNGLDVSRYGLSIGKRVWKRAVRRNRVRRIFREAFRLSRSELPAGLDVVMIAAEPHLEPGLEETRRELVALATRAWRRLERRAERERPS